MRARIPARRRLPARRLRGRPMGYKDDADLRLSAQRALLGHVVPSLRAVLLDIIPTLRP